MCLFYFVLEIFSEEKYQNSPILQSYILAGEIVSNTLDKLV